MKTKICFFSLIFLAVGINNAFAQSTEPAPSDTVKWEGKIFRFSQSYVTDDGTAVSEYVYLEDAKSRLVLEVSTNPARKQTLLIREFLHPWGPETKEVYLLSVKSKRYGDMYSAAGL